jgi:hypothetical protein
MREDEEARGGRRRARWAQTYPRPAQRGVSPPDDDRRRQRSARLADHRVACPQPRRRRAPFRRDAGAGDEGGRQARLSPVRRGGAPGSAAAASIGFICDEMSTDPWTAIGLDGVREKAWERGLTVMVMATRGDADMESATLAQLTAQPLIGSSMRPSTRASLALRRHWRSCRPCS